MSLTALLFYSIFFILGSIFGSFACCQVWRFYERAQGKKLGSRSICLSCKHRLAWVDNIPILSWLLLRGKCRYCHTKIGSAEILSELSLGFVFIFVAIKYFSNFLISFDFFTALPTTYFIEPLLLLISLVIFWILLIYDAKWRELPVLLMLTLIPFSFFFFFVSHSKIDPVQPLLAVSLLAGVYYLLYFFSKEKLVGGGDWILCLSIAIFLGRLELAIFELFLSNFLASLFNVPQILNKTRHPVPFGPFLIISMLIILLFKEALLKFFVIY